MTSRRDGRVLEFDDEFSAYLRASNYISELLLALEARRGGEHSRNIKALRILNEIIGELRGCQRDERSASYFARVLLEASGKSANELLNIFKNVAQILEGREPTEDEYKRLKGQLLRILHIMANKSEQLLNEKVLGRSKRGGLPTPPTL